MSNGFGAVEKVSEAHRLKLGEAQYDVASSGSAQRSLGALSAFQLGQLLAVYDDIDRVADEFPSIIKSKRVGRLLSSQNVAFQWGWAYERSLPEMMAMAFSGIDEANAVLEAARSGDPLQNLMDFAKVYEPDFSTGRPKASKLLWNLAVMMAIHHSMRSLKLYARSLNRLIVRGQQGDDESFILAVRVDPSCFDAPSLSKRMAIAQMEKDRRFIKRIYKAAADGPNASLRVHEKLRFTTVVLDQSGSFEAASKDHLYTVLVEELNLYESRKGDPKKGLFRNLDLWRKVSST